MIWCARPACGTRTAPSASPSSSRPIQTSASGMAALAVNIMCLEKAIIPSISDEYFYSKASFLARLGSGSACRSIKGEVVVWGNHDAILGSSDLFGVAFSEIHENFKNFQEKDPLLKK